jgi:hypothetical protein
MNKYLNQSEATRVLAAQQTHGDMHPGHGVIATPTHDDIARRAYDIYVATGCSQGQCKQNWHQAENDLRASGRTAGQEASPSDAVPRMEGDAPTSIFAGKNRRHSS